MDVLSLCLVFALTMYAGVYLKIIA